MNSLSLDLRKRIIDAYKEKKVSANKLSERFSVSLSSVNRLIARYKETGSIKPKLRGGGKPPAIDETGCKYLMELFKGGLDLTLQETCDEYMNKFNIKVGTSTMDRALKKLNITRKKKSSHDPEKDTPRVKMLTQEYFEAIDSCDPDDFIFIDETGATLNMDRNYSRSPKGERATGACPIASGTRVSTIGAISNEGMETAMSFEGTLNGDVLLFFISTFLLPILRPESIVIMDNCRVHKVDGVRELIESTGAKVLYLPPYSPELNPIEFAWSKVKGILRTIKARTKDLVYDAISKALHDISWSDSQGWFDHAKI